MAAPTRISGGLRASQQGNVHVQGLTREQHTTTAIDSAKSQTHSAKTAVFGVFSPNGSAVWPRHHCKLRDHRHQSGGNCIIRAATRRRYAASQLLMLQNPHRFPCGEQRRGRMARLRCPWAPEGPEGTGELQNAGPGRGAGGRWQGQGGPRDRPLRAAGSRVAISRAGRRPPAHTAARPIKASHAAVGTPAGGPPPTGTSSSPAPQPGPTAPATPVGPQAPHTHTKTPTRNRVGVSEPPVGIEPTTYSLRVNRSAD